MDHNSVSLPVLVIGAGPVGLTFAAEMARYGVPCRIVDRAKGTKEISKALILHARTQEVFDAMGIIGEAHARSIPLQRIEMHAYGKYLGHGEMEGVDSAYTHPIILGQNVTEHILQEHLGRLGTGVEWQVEATELAQDPEGVSITLRHAGGREENVRAHYVLGADGTHSITRESAALAFHGESYAGQAFIQADSKLRWSLPRGVSYLWFTDEGYMMMIEMPDDLVRTFVSVPDTNPDDKSEPKLEEIQSALNRLGGGLDAELYDPVWVARYRTSHRVASRFREGRIFIAGDAAHEHVPIGGQGMNTSIQDAFNLAWKLAFALHGRAKPALLDTFNLERHPVAESLLKGTDAAYTKLLGASDIMKSAIRTFGPFLIRQEAVRKRIRNTIEEVEISYVSGLLAEDHGGSSGPKAGERAPDATVVELPDKRTVFLRDILRAPCWTLLLFSGRETTAEQYGKLLETGQSAVYSYGSLLNTRLVAANAPGQWDSAEVPVVADFVYHLHDRYGVKNSCVYLIRPDWYVGFRAPPEQREHLQTYLSKFLEQKAT